MITALKGLAVAVVGLSSVAATTPFWPDPSESIRVIGVTARCMDGTYSASKVRRGTCAAHGGVAEWIRKD